MDSNGALFAGISNFGAGLGQAINNYKEKKEKNQEFTARSKAIEALIKTHGEDMGIAKEQLDAFLAPDAEETPKARYARLSQAVEQSTLSNALAKAKQQRLEQAQVDQAGQQLQQVNQLQGGIGGGVLRPEAQQRIQGMAQDPTMQAAASIQRATGRTPTADDIAKFMAVNQRGTGRRIMEPFAMRVTGKNGEPLERTIDKLSGEVLGEGPVGQNKYVLTPEEQISVASGTELAKKDAEKASAFVDSIPEAAESAQLVLPQIQTIRELYRNGAKSGFGQEFKTKAGSFAASIGLIKPQEQASQEQLTQLFATQALQTAKDLMKGQGAVSDAERQLILKASADIGKTPDANMRIISLTEAIANRHMAAEAERQRLVDDGKGTKEIAEQLRRWRAKNPLDKFTAKDDEPKGVIDKAKDIKSGFTEDKRKRLEELRAKLGK